MDLNSLLVSMVERKGQVLHLIGGSPPLMKPATGALAPLIVDPLSVVDVKNILENILTPAQKQRLEREREINTAYSVEGVSRFRASIFFQRGTLAGIFRLTPPTPLSLEELGLPSLIKESAGKPQGFVLFTGPKGSGKSQTLAATLDYLLENKAVQIVSLENPIEFLLKNKKGVIYQREVGTDVNDFKSGLVTALRQSPDVVAITELPDYETVMSVLTAASAGLLVIATMTANGVVAALEQMLELAPPHFQQAMRGLIAATLELAISQLLLNKKGGGFAAAVEILIGTSQSKNLIRDNKIPQLVPCMNNNRDAGMQSQEIAIRNFLKKNWINLDEAVAKAARPEELKRLAALPV